MTAPDGGVATFASAGDRDGACTVPDGVGVNHASLWEFIPTIPLLHFPLSSATFLPQMAGFQASVFLALALWWGSFVTAGRFAEPPPQPAQCQEHLPPTRVTQRYMDVAPHTLRAKKPLEEIHCLTGFFPLGNIF